MCLKFKLPKSVPSLFLIVLFGCQQAGFGGGGGANRFFRGSANNLAANYSEKDSEPLSSAGALSALEWLEATKQMSFEELGQLSTLEYLEKSISLIPNGDIEVSGHLFYDLGDFFAQHKDLVIDTGLKFSTLEEYFQAQDIIDFNDIHKEDVSNGYKLLEELFSSGKLEEILAYDGGKPQETGGGDSADTSQLLALGRAVDDKLKASILIALAVPPPVDNLSLGLLDACRSKGDCLSKEARGLALLEDGSGAPAEAAAVGVAEAAKPSAPINIPVSSPEQFATPSGDQFEIWKSNDPSQVK